MGGAGAVSAGARTVEDAKEPSEHMMLVDDRWMRCPRPFDEVPAALGAQRVEAYRDQLEALWMKLVAQLLPHGQVA